MEISQKIYKGVTPSRKPIRSDGNHDIHVRKLKVGEATFPTNPEKGLTDKHKGKYVCHPSNEINGAKKI